MRLMNLSDFDYNLPKELIAQEPVSPRDHSRLLIYDKKSKEIEHKHFYDLPSFLKKDDLLFVNNSKVFKARFFAQKQSGGKLEIFLLKTEDKENNIWQCLIGGRISSDKNIFLNQSLLGKIIDKKENIFLVSFEDKYNDFIKKIDSFAEVPLPPYIKRDIKNGNDNFNYQTVYAKEEKLGSSAAPTAGLHFTDGLLQKIKNKGVKIVEATLHVGLGTFLPIKSENILDHKMHSEDVEISREVINEIIKTKNKSGRIIAVGTTSCRILESLAQYLDWDEKTKTIKEYKGPDLKFSTSIFIYPGYKFKLLDCLISNFHLPKSSLLLLLSALAGREEILDVYEKAIKEHYRFFSYGDAMFVI